MEIKEQNILRLHIEYDNTKESSERDEAYEYLDNRFGRYTHRIKRIGPKMLNGKADLFTGYMIVEVEQ